MTDTVSVYDALDSIASECWRIADAHGFHDERNICGDIRDATPGERLALIASEVGEAVQALQKSGKPGEWYVEVDGKVEGVLAEIADVIIRCFDYAEHHAPSDLGRVLEAKMEYNRRRPHLHGKAGL